MALIDSARIPVSAPIKTEAADAISTPEVPNGLKVICRAGTGTFCEVWKVHSDRDSADYALKRLRSEWRDNATARKLLANEARVAAAVRSRNVVYAATIQPTNAEFGVVLEWIEGTPLEEYLLTEKQIPIETAIWIIRQCAQGLLALEQAGYAHGDVKPANIVLARNGDVKLVDLGFARRIDASLRENASRAVTGTAEYMAPESLSRHESSPVLKDIYSLGVTLFRMLTGALPFTAETTAEVLQLQRTARPPHLRRKRPDVPSELAQLIQQMLAKQPIRRPSNLHSLVRTLIDFELELFPRRLAG